MCVYVWKVRVTYPIFPPFVRKAAYPIRPLPVLHFVTWSICKLRNDNNENRRKSMTINSARSRKCVARKSNGNSVYSLFIEPKESQRCGFKQLRLAWEVRHRGRHTESGCQPAHPGSLRKQNQRSSAKAAGCPCHPYRGPAVGAEEVAASVGERERQRC